MIKLKLKETRLNKQINQNQLAVMTGLSRNTLYLIEHHKTDSIAFETLDKLCKALQCKVEDLIEYQPD